MASTSGRGRYSAEAAAVGGATSSSSSNNNAAAEEAIRVLLRKAAHVHYKSLSAEERASIREGFYGLDDTGDGKISLPEFMKVAPTRPSRRSRAIIPKLFDYVDADRSGYLEFGEYVALIYLVDAGLRPCSACSSPVVLLGYTCRTCWAHQPRHASSSSSATFDLCLQCYASNSFHHPLDHEFVDSSSFYHTLLSGTNEESLNQVQCCICGDYHRMDIEGMIMDGTAHVVKSQKPSNEFICEWCISWNCNNCGKFFQGPPSSARPNKWLRTNLHCDACGEHGDMTDLEPLFEVLERSDLCKKCSTCEFKVRNHTLWEKYKRR